MFSRHIQNSSAVTLLEWLLPYPAAAHLSALSLHLGADGISGSSWRGSVQVWFYSGRDVAFYFTL